MKTYPHVRERIKNKTAEERRGEERKVKVKVKEKDGDEFTGKNDRRSTISKMAKKEIMRKRRMNQKKSYLRGQEREHGTATSP